MSERSTCDVVCTNVEPEAPREEEWADRISIDDLFKEAQAEAIKQSTRKDQI
jgi:hypothetical protein